VSIGGEKDEEGTLCRNKAYVVEKKQKKFAGKTKKEEAGKPKGGQSGPLQCRNSRGEAALAEKLQRVWLNEGEARDRERR